MAAEACSSNPSGSKESVPRQFRVLMWCAPRSTSSILTKCLSFLPKTRVFFEPYYFCYEYEKRLRSLGLGEGGDSTIREADSLTAAELISGGENCGDGRVDFKMFSYHRIQELLENPEPALKGVFLKEMAYAITGQLDFLPARSSGYRHAFLLRHPIKVFVSWRKVMFKLNQELFPEAERSKSQEAFHMVRDVPAMYAPPGHFFKELYDLWKHVKDNLDSSPVILDSDDLLADPAGVLPKFCGALGMPYSEDLLRWDASPATTNYWVSAFAPPNDFEFIRIYCRRRFIHLTFFPHLSFPLWKTSLMTSGSVWRRACRITMRCTTLESNCIHSIL